MSGMGRRIAARLGLSRKSPDPATRTYPSHVAGTAYENRAPYIWKRVRPGDLLVLRPEPDNPHDPLAIALIHHSGLFGFGKHIGYVPARHRWIGKSMAEADHLSVTVAAVDPSDDDPDVPWVTLTVKVRDHT